MKKRWFGAAALTAACLAALLLFQGAAGMPELQDGLFSWSGAVLAPEKRGELLNVLERLDVGTLYQRFPADHSEAVSFLTDMNRSGVQVWLLTGRPEWGLERDGASLKGEIDRAAELAARSGGGLAGVMVDVEPYLTDAWDEDENEVMERYVAAMAAARQYAGEQGIALLACIPYWYDNHHADALSRLIQTGCDGVAVMNYYREGEAKHIGTEAKLARSAGKPVVCIFEFQAPGVQGLTPENTYYTDGLAAAGEAWEAVREAVNYQELHFAYHEYASVRELLDRET